MKLELQKMGDVAVVKMTIETLDASNSTEFKEAIQPVLETELNVVLDLAGLAFVDSSGLGAFLSCMRRLHAKGGDLRLCAMSDSVRTVFELVRMHRVVDICNDVDEAVRRFA
jgi:anti-sigma B factor antagonist